MRLKNAIRRKKIPVIKEKFRKKIISDNMEFRIEDDPIYIKSNILIRSRQTRKPKESGINDCRENFILSVIEMFGIV